LITFTGSFKIINEQAQNPLKRGYQKLRTGAWQITTTRYDEHGNEVWNLDAGNRAAALADPVDSAAAAERLATITVYNETGTRVEETYGPMRDVVLDNGQTVEGRLKTVQVYDDEAAAEGVPVPGRPNPGPDTDTFNLVVEERTSVVDGIGEDGYRRSFAALKRGGNLIGACPYTDTDPHGQIDRVFALAQAFGIDVDMHLDFDLNPGEMDLPYVCRRAEDLGYGGRVAVGHVTKLSMLEPEAFTAAAKRLQNAGVALTILPSTDLYLMGRTGQHEGMRGVAPAHRFLKSGVNCSLATNNVLNPFTPFGDCSLIRMANLYANVCQLGTPGDIAECFNMITTRAAALMNLQGYGITVGNHAEQIVLDCESPHAAVCELAPVLYAFKRGRRTVTRQPPMLHYPKHE
jgi:cytosine/adenosine deaminase-related metal-dependent hydrolase